MTNRTFTKKQSMTFAWRRQNRFNPKTIKKSHINLKIRFKLLFRPSKYSMDTEGDITAMVRYKVLDGVTYILSVRHYDSRGKQETKEG